MYTQVSNGATADAQGEIVDTIDRIQLCKFDAGSIPFESLFFCKFYPLLG